MEQNPEIKIERITVEKHNGKKLVGLLHETGSSHIAVTCHGYRSDKESRTLKPIAEALVNKKLSVFRFDFSGNGESKDDGELFQFSNYWGEVDDLRAVIQYFTNKGRRIFVILGHSKGANVVLLYASVYNDVPVVVNLSARFHLEKGIEERLGAGFMERLRKDGYIDVVENQNGKVANYCVTFPSVMDRLVIKMEDWCQKIDKKCRVLTVHGFKDERVPRGDALLFHKFVPNHTTHFIDRANHCYTMHKDELISAILSFIEDVQLATDT